MNERAAWRLPVLGLILLMLTMTGCLHYIVEIRVDSDGEVTVAERIVVDPEWRRTVGDTLQAAEHLIKRYETEAQERGGKVKTFGTDSAQAFFHYESLAGFAHYWPDTSDNHSRWDRSLYRQRSVGDTLLDELILFRMSPPEPDTDPSKKLPTLTFVIHTPVPAYLTNSHQVRGNSYYWHFTENLTAPDSVLIAWPAVPKS